MDKKKVLMIHEVFDWMLDLDLSDYIITFDDGLYSQYKKLEHFKKFNTPKIYFISTGILASEDIEQNESVIECAKAHELYFKNEDTSNYMKWSQVKEIASTKNCFIGGHSHAHRDLRSNTSIKDLHLHLKDDTDLMLKKFKENGIEIQDFCFPYNYEAPLYKEILKQNGIINFFGKERVAIEDLKNAI
ncbi:polysaccharide deacetylase family protein [Halobacteriovorax vibrionivorans]|uniref:Polysaccharide deacetylase family protein n=1 Tax=Halobacteriovorax vibrionivorans TaxID=2152716 RepID=A0ABY0IIM0_9BACT|nr:MULTISPECIES: polysaccharide deacetylase family protein [Halobacteriovorax]RZF22814.1 polysaccharide deacetylase family protein [Halobacteriovorax vibrionivorans]TGD47393.1 polysaccharide deacetylase family protein [Halobacteriovorax sp. Y22]